MTTNIVLMAQTEQKNTNSPELPTRLMMGVVVWTAMKIIRNWKVMMELLTKDFKSEENHSAAIDMCDTFNVKSSSSVSPTQ